MLTSLVVQQLGIHLPIQGPQVGPGTFHMPWGNSACEPQLKPTLQRLCALTMEPASCNYEAHISQGLCPKTREVTAMRRPHTAIREQLLLATTRESLHSNEDSVQTKRKSLQGHYHLSLSNVHCYFKQTSESKVNLIKVIIFSPI